jgi:phenylacetyl-CoA:acceptor oxidoreductase subunit 2
MKVETADPMAPKRQHHWDWRAACNFIAGGSGGGLLFFAAAASFLTDDVRALVFAGMALIGAGLVCVWAEIGRPWRALNVFRHLGSSWMSREAAIAPLVFVSGALALFSTQALSPRCSPRRVLGAAFLYSQARMLTADKEEFLPGATRACFACCW